jgi:hypothetical protein
MQQRKGAPTIRRMALLCNVALVTLCAYVVSTVAERIIARAEGWLAYRSPWRSCP